jgi:periplasmic divalent cation tolerance protein
MSAVTSPMRSNRGAIPRRYGDRPATVLNETATSQRRYRGGMASILPETLTVLTTVESAAKAEVLARGAVEQRVAACAQINGPVTSVYRWEDAVQTDPEWQVLFKTAAARYGALEAYIRAAHDYDVPEIIATRVVRGGADYLRWVVEECADPDATAEA